MFCGATQVGHVSDAFESDATWYGNLEVTLRRGSAAPTDRILDFVAFSQDWNERALSQRENPPEPADFGAFEDLIADGLWTVSHASGNRHRIAEAPVFLRSGELSWRLVDA